MTAFSLPAAPAARRLAARYTWSSVIFVIAIILLVIEAAIAPNFGSFDFQSLFVSGLPLALAGMSQGAVVLSGGIDLSVGSVIALINVCSARLMLHASFGQALLISLALLAAGAAIGALTALAISLTRVPDIIATLATLFVWSGLALVIMPTPGGGAPVQYGALLTDSVGSPWLPGGLVILMVIYLVIWWPLRRSRLGHGLYAVGSHRPAALLAGLSVTRFRLAAYAAGGLLAALAGLALTAATSVGNATAGQLYTLNSVGVVVLGGISLAGGKGTLAGAVAAAFALTLIGSIMTFLGLPSSYAQVLQGALVVVIVMAGGLATARRNR